MNMLELQHSNATLLQRNVPSSISMMQQRDAIMQSSDMHTCPWIATQKRTKPSFTPLTQAKAVAMRYVMQIGRE
jgi:hypothetical protein